jgi:phosphoribosylformylglycinamidine synthase
MEDRNRRVALPEVVIMRFGVVIFPGSNCDYDCIHVLRNVLAQDVVELWHGDSLLDDVDCVVLPGGFAYGDYLRAGAVAATSPVMPSVKSFAASGKPVLGICNGFQVLLEAGLLPGAMLRNQSLQFRCRQVLISVESTKTPFTWNLREGQILQMPVAHGEGNYFAPKDLLDDIERQVVFRYTEDANPNGSARFIAGVCNKAGNVVGLMPHPERASEAILGSTDGRLIFEAVIAYVTSRSRVPALPRSRAEALR